MIHVIIQQDLRRTEEVKRAARQVEAEKDPANVKWVVSTAILDKPAEVINDYKTEAEAIAKADEYTALSDEETIIEKIVDVPADPQPRSYSAVNTSNNDLRVDTGAKDKNGFPIYDVTPRPPQLHTLGESLDPKGNPNVLYAAEWDLKSPWITVYKGAISDLKLAYMGHPLEEQATYEARIEAERVAYEKAQAKLKADWEAEHPDVPFEDRDAWLQEQWIKDHPPEPFP